MSQAISLEEYRRLLRKGGPGCSGKRSARKESPEEDLQRTIVQWMVLNEHQYLSTFQLLPSLVQGCLRWPVLISGISAVIAPRAWVTADCIPCPRNSAHQPAHTPHINDITPAQSRNGVTEHGRKELVAVEDGYRESEASWLELLLGLRERGLTTSPKLAIGDGALGFFLLWVFVFCE